ASVAVLSIGGSAKLALQLLQAHPSVVAVVLVTPALIAPEDLVRVQVDLGVIIGELETALPRAALSAAVAEAGGQLELIPGADRTFHRNLPGVGKAAVGWLRESSAR